MIHLTHQEIAPAVETLKNKKKKADQKKTIFLIMPIISLLLISIACIFVYLSNSSGYPIYILGFELKSEYVGFILLGFLAQGVDGAIGMAYGLITTTSLLSLGIPPAMASACTHISEVFTTGASGFSHWKLGNVNRKMFYSLVTPAIIGVIIGAYILTSLDGKIIKPFVSIYLLAMGLIVIGKAIYLNQVRKKKSKNIQLLGFTGGFMDAIGGGGWGAIVTSTLLGQRRSPKYAIGTVNFTEFFVTLASAGTFIALLSLETEYWIMILCIIIGGFPASLFSAYLCTIIKARALMFVVGTVIVAMSLVGFIGILL